MGKLGKFITVLSLIIGIAFFAIGLKTAKDKGMSITDIGVKLIANVRNYQTGSEGASFEKIDRTEEIPIDSSTGEIHISSRFADISVEYADTNTVKIKLSGDINSDLSKNVLTKETTDRALFLKIAESYNFKPTSAGFNAAVTFPKSFEGKLFIKNESGDISVLYNGPELHAASVSGNVTVTMESEYDSNSVINSTSGDISLNGSYIRYTINSQSGNADVSGTSVSGNISTVSGNITLKGDSLDTDSSLKTVSGDIDVNIKEGYSFSGGSTSGDLFAGEDRITGSARKDVNGGGNHLDVSSISGQITLNAN